MEIIQFERQFANEIPVRKLTERSAVQRNGKSRTVKAQLIFVPVYAGVGTWIFSEGPERCK